MTVHITACIHPKAHVENSTIGRYTRVWQFASVIRNSLVGESCNIATCSIVDGSMIGNHCIVSHSAFIDPGIEIGDFVFIGPGVKLCNDQWPLVSKDGWHHMPDLISGKIVVTKIKNNASLGAGVVVLPGVTIGVGSMIAAAAVVDKNVPDHSLYKRSGEIVPIDPDREPVRARWVQIRGGLNG